VATDFPRGAARFLAGLKRNNRKDWFDAHREEYEADLLEPAKEFVIELGAPLRKLRAKLRVDPRINYGVKRMNRDTRFSKDKTLYKDHLTLWWWEGDDKDSSPGYWFDLQPTKVALAVGMHMIEPKALDRYREAVVDETRGKKLATTVKKLEAKGYQLEGPKTKRVPRGFDADHPRERYLKHTGIYMWTETPIPRTSFAAHCLGHYRALTPLQEWLVETL
jgi:uncharacterized protein (TIGR02453 family)